MKQTDADRLGQISKDAQHSLSVARDALVEALDQMKLVVGDDGNDIEQSTEAPWPVSQLSFVSPMTAGSGQCSWFWRESAQIAPSDKHRHGIGFQVHIWLTVPPHENIVVNHTGTDDARNEHAQVAIKDAFAAARRQVDALAA